MQPLSTIRPTEDPTEDELTEVLVTRMLLKSYFDIVRKKIEDDVPKAIMHFLVLVLITHLYSPLDFHVFSILRVSYGHISGQSFEKGPSLDFYSGHL